MSSKFFIPDWVLSSTSLTPGAKLILAVLSTRSTETKEGRTSFGMGVGAIADLVGMHYVSVDRLIKQLLKEGYMKSLKGGYLLVGEPEEKKEEEVTVAEVASDEPVYLFEGCISLNDCKGKLRDGFRLKDLEHSYRTMPGSAPHRDSIYELLCKIEEAAKKKGLPASHIFTIVK